MTVGARWPAFTTSLRVRWDGSHSQPEMTVPVTAGGSAPAWRVWWISAGGSAG